MQQRLAPSGTVDLDETLEEDEVDASMVDEVSEASLSRVCGPDWCDVCDSGCDLRDPAAWPIIFGGISTEFSRWCSPHVLCS